MKESEKADKNVNAREIIANVLKELDMNAPSFAKATGINYQRIFDLQRGRTKKFNPGVVNMICEAFPQISKSYLYTGEGSVLNRNMQIELEKETSGASSVKIDDVAEMLNKVLDISKQVNEKDRAVSEKFQLLMEKERELTEREIALVKREAELQARIDSLNKNKD